jgi:hypothetical protein
VSSLETAHVSPALHSAPKKEERREGGRKKGGREGGRKKGRREEGLGWHY